MFDHPPAATLPDLTDEQHWKQWSVSPLRLTVSLVRCFAATLERVLTHPVATGHLENEGDGLDIRDQFRPRCVEGLDRLYDGSFRVGNASRMVVPSSKSPHHRQAPSGMGSY